MAMGRRRILALLLVAWATALEGVQQERAGFGVGFGFPNPFVGGGQEFPPLIPAINIPIPKIPEIPSIPQIPKIPEIPVVPTQPLPEVPPIIPPRQIVPEVPPIIPPRQVVPEVPPIIPEVPIVPKVPEVPIVPKVPEIPEVPVVPVVPEVPVVPVVPVVPEVPKVPEYPVVPEVPKVPEVPVVPVVPKVPVVPIVPEVPSIPEVPIFPAVPKIPALPEIPLPKVPGYPTAVPKLPAIPGGLLPGGMIPRTGVRGFPFPFSGGRTFPFPGSGAGPAEAGFAGLRPGFYKEKCPAAESIVRKVLEQVVERDPRAPAHILRLQFHDCFVLGCDASILLDDTHIFKGEKTANPNRNSARGFEAIDLIKAALEKECEGVVSCADILTMAARDSVALTGGPSWEVHLGRRDSLTASRALANTDIPPPNATLPQLIAAFAKKGLSEVDLVALSGSHTIGVTRCASFRQRLYNFAGTRRPDPSIDPALFRSLEHICPPKGNAQGATPLDIVTPTKFDSHFFVNLEVHKGVLTSDQVLFSPYAPTSPLVTAFAYDQEKFFKQFAASMVRMAAIKPLLGAEGQIRKECRFVNHEKY